MGYRGDDRDGGERWRDRDSRSWSEGGGGRGRDHGRDGWNEGRREEAGWGPGLGGDRDRDRGEHRSHGGEDRGFFERASEGVRSWFGGDSDDQGRGRWERGDERGRGGPGGQHRDNGYGPGTLGGGGFGGGWGNQAGESWNRERPGERGWFTDSVGGERGNRPGASGPSSQRPERQEERSRPGGPDGGGYSAMTGDYGRGAHLHDPHYADWRQRQIADLDRDYEEYRREHQAKFEQEFGAWRAKRQGQRQLMGGITENMEVVGSDGAHVGTVDKVRGDRIILTRSDPNAGGIHHSVPCSWVESAEGKVTLNRTADQAFAEWRDEDRNRALFERHESGEEGPHMLNRSFSGTYSDDRKD